MLNSYTGIALNALKNRSFIRGMRVKGVFTSIVELQAAINRFIAEANGTPKPFVWTKSPTPSSPLSPVGDKR